MRPPAAPRPSSRSRRRMAASAAWRPASERLSYSSSSSRSGSNLRERRAFIGCCWRTYVGAYLTIRKRGFSYWLLGELMVLIWPTGSENSPPVPNITGPNLCKKGSDWPRGTTDEGTIWPIGSEESPPAPARDLIGRERGGGDYLTNRKQGISSCHSIAGPNLCALGIWLAAGNNGWGDYLTNRKRGISSCLNITGPNLCIKGSDWSLGKTGWEGGLSEQKEILLVWHCLGQNWSLKICGLASRILFWFEIMLEDPDP